MKLLISVISFSICAGAQADLDLKCKGEVSLEGCADRVENTISKMGCNVETQATECFYGLVDDPNSDKPDVNIETDTVLCSIKSKDCSHAPEMLFSIGESCRGSEDKIQIPKSSKVTNNYWKGFWGSYSRVVCKRKK